jgi:hypothetical protein
MENTSLLNHPGGFLLAPPGLQVLIARADVGKRPIRDIS